MYTILYFSPTGNAKHLALSLATKLDLCEENIHPLEFTDAVNFICKEHLVILYPVHGFNAARTAKRFVRNLPSGKCNYISLIGVGCTNNWLNGAVSSDLRKSLIKKKYTILVDEITAMPLTFIMNFPDELNYRLIAESEERIKAIASKITVRTASTKTISTKSKIVNFVGKIESPAARLFGLELHANSKCISCGSCWNNCPEGNIKEKKNGRPEFRLKCSMCMRCIYKCPEDAISPRISKFIPIKNGYTISKYIMQ